MPPLVEVSIDLSEGQRKSMADVPRLGTIKLRFLASQIDPAQMKNPHAFKVPKQTYNKIQKAIKAKKGAHILFSHTTLHANKEVIGGFWPILGSIASAVLPGLISGLFNKGGAEGGFVMPEGGSEGGYIEGLPQGERIGIPKVPISVARSMLPYAKEMQFSKSDFQAMIEGRPMSKRKSDMAAFTDHVGDTIKSVMGSAEASSSAPSRKRQAAKGDAYRKRYKAALKLLIDNEATEDFELDTWLEFARKKLGEKDDDLLEKVYENQLTWKGDDGLVQILASSLVAAPKKGGKIVNFHMGEGRI